MDAFLHASGTADGHTPLKIAIVTNNPAPYRVPVYERLARMPGVSLHVIFCSEREPYRLWDIPPMRFDHTILPENYFMLNGKYVHNNPEVLRVLRDLAPDVVVTNGYFPTGLYAYGYAVASGAAHIPMTDGTDVSERSLSAVHRIVRRIVFARSNAFVSASAGGSRLFASYGIAPQRRFQSCLCIDNERFRAPLDDSGKRYDFIFCGRMDAAKGPLFALDVAARTAQRLGRPVSILYAGSGEQEEETKRRASELTDLVEADFHGFAAQAELPGLYRSARLFLFPTLADVWGVVANEACATGLPVLVSPFAGVADELVRDGENGFVCEMDADKWAGHAAMLLGDEVARRRFAERSLELAGRFTFDDAAQGLHAACSYAAKEKPRKRRVARSG